MDPALQKTLNLFVENTAELDSAFRFQKPPSRQSSALLFTLEGKRANCDAVKECSKMIKRHTELLSPLRLRKHLSLSTYLSFYSNPENVFSNSLAMFQPLKKVFPYYGGTDHAIVAIMIASACKPEHYPAATQRVDALFNRTMKKLFIVKECCNAVFITLLTLSRLDVDTALGLYEEQYAWIKNERSFFGIPDLALLSALTGEGITASARILQMKSSLDVLGFPKTHYDYIHRCVKLLALVHSKPELLVKDLRDAHSFLIGFRDSSLCTTDFYLLYFMSAALVALHHSKMENGGVPSPLVAAIAPAMSLQLVDSWS
ncbi:MAG: DUF4003 family protein [Clostridiales bacterium]|jgi:hypothetical protein|nr:DUF4003 family protein [Clostridiales bacterium]